MAEMQRAFASGLLKLQSHSAHLLAQTDYTPAGQQEQVLQRLEGVLQREEEPLMHLVEELAADTPASDHCKLHTENDELQAFAALHNQTAGIPDIQAEAAHKEALCELAGLHSLCSHPQTRLTSTGANTEFFPCLFLGGFEADDNLGHVL